jgi:hypothetical protein
MIRHFDHPPCRALAGPCLAAVLSCVALVFASPARADHVLGSASSARMVGMGPDRVSKLVEAQRLTPVPESGLRVDLWTDPDPGSVVQPGDRARIYCRTNADCYVTVISVDTEGRLRLISPVAHEDGWVEAGRTYQVPAPRAGYDLVFSGPPGMEYLYAVASMEPVRDRYPSWLIEGRVWEPNEWQEAEDPDPYSTGWIIGDPFYQMRAFCSALVRHPERTELYASAYVYFHLGRRVPYPRYVCADCHRTRWVDPYGASCSAVRIQVGGWNCSGWIDFHVAFAPRYTYVVCPDWRPRQWPHGPWSGPGGRWVWSSADGRDLLRRNFADARDDQRHAWNREQGRAAGKGEIGEERREETREPEVVTKPARPERPHGEAREVKPPSRSESKDARVQVSARPAERKDERGRRPEGTGRRETGRPRGPVDRARR